MFKINGDSVDRIVYPTTRIIKLYNFLKGHSKNKIKCYNSENESFGRGNFQLMHGYAFSST